MRGDGRLGDVALLDLVGPREVLHRLVDALEVAAGHRKVAPRRGTARQHDRVVLIELADRHVVTDVDVGAERRALCLHLRDAAFEMTLLHLELGDAVAQQSTDSVGAFVHDDVVSGPCQLLRGCESGRARTDDRDALPRLRRRRHRHHPTLVPRSIDDRDLDLLDRHRILVDAEHARRLAWCRAQPPGELGKVVGGVQPLARGRPVAAPDEIVPFGDEVPQRAAVVAERDAAVHAASRLGPDDRQEASPVVDLVPVPHSLPDRAAGTVLPRGGEEALRVSHGALQRQQGSGPDHAVLP